MLDVHIKRREFVKRAVYAVPVILTLKAMPSFASAGSARGDYGDEKEHHNWSQGKSSLHGWKAHRYGQSGYRRGDH